MTEAQDIDVKLESARREFRDELIEAGLLIPMGIDGLYGRGAVFEGIIDGIDYAVRAKGAEVYGDRAKVLRFPPVFPREQFEKTDYIASFPDLTGAISTFTGGNAEHRALLADRDAGLPWDGHLNPAGTMLVSAACHPSYATLPSDLPDGGVLMDIYGYCFRHEPAIDPARMQAFRMHEYVLVGTPEQAQAHRDNWVDHGMAVLTGLGLDARPAAANDPFFGRVGKMLAANQREEELKTELLVRLYGDLHEGTAVVSANCHRDHFGQTFSLHTADGGVAHSACVGFGMERIALALVRTHGLDPAAWPARVQTAMGR
ncbi:amino acid--[acyl-carrier-protein] ligase [Mycolicibacterium fortuitum]|uniref:Amino acid--[acyl-carrier-protein] ligase n=2 Tax=Mycolicibacterium fortuitum TaxID=1766 RepID=A0AAE4VBF3_MYCFO|nr:amino acid--[acyl-carrier-protein] ligase [Mycolicibacterium fortuitum]MCV7140643.1 amino acid--[acyl-carrier-protein] ligase [Mycolicibacterium fortuitum]MDV7191968.1 amino acid--[acyl-carrier-protein] ligase [Mycolicibacterium fortuitum]MDV7203604.1 amino acid--[acyl-carrier-protein] ligase [Mycolicibacterium fortuitum]MDV7226078.1 amino acid--[acyl-carrier-protein] ligase [Mycolicibacterium fortuitum]MDV7258567.1 amino acid--[acyl-carrier-protein] ligase [Mycolicibacterium fortuitum]